MKNILIFGAGSIGNHMSKAASDLSCNIFVTDICKKALIRMKKSIYPSRYGKWNKKINLIMYHKVFKLNFFFDLIIIGTPPHTHLNLFLNCKKKLKFKKILIEKPLTTYNNKSLKILERYSKNIFIFCGYNHSVSQSFQYLIKLIKENKKKIRQIEITWREGFKGILSAHPWLKNEFESYLGNYKIGGGALQEHSHGIHILVIILKILKIKINKLKNKIIIFKKKNNIAYDRYSTFSLDINKIFIKYETDFFTNPANKEVKLIVDNKTVKWSCSIKKNFDVLKIYNHSLNVSNTLNFRKTRSSEFKNELKHIFLIKNKSQYIKSPLYYKNAVEVLKLVKQFF
jgi:hypothetical protein